ncbi:MAG: 30S ribosomal protein S7 [Candidatus Thermoplasmatota archaeon]|nr:30S ribosomal protein S7 [Candidatus Thermoplasmatota archaeon]MBU4591625.1 30S ribosomal protein S7 [Candidatus Thermoplasmatota archaeon]
MSDDKTSEIKPETQKKTPEPVKVIEKPAKPEPTQEPAAEEKPKAPAEAKKKEEKPAPAPKAEVSTEEKPKDPAKPEPKKIIGIPPDKLKLFDKYDMSEVVVSDAGLARYINLDPVMVPHTGARHANRPFAKSKMNIVERLVNNMMRNEEYTGKKTKTYSAVMTAFSIIESKTKKNPIQVFIDALENTTPREEVTRLKYGGVSVPKAVDISSSRRLDIALRNICKGAINASYKNTKPIEICLANEIMLAAKGDMNSFAVSKKEEVERVAGSAR